MAIDDRLIFKRCMEQTCAAVHTPFGRFAAAVGLHDFLLDTFDEPRNPKEIAVLTLVQLCAGEMKHHDQIVCLAVIKFLDETLGRPETDQDARRRLKDLAELIGESATSTQLEGWVETWYE